MQAILQLLQRLSINARASGKGQVLPQQFLSGARDSAFRASSQQRPTLLEEDHKDGKRWKAGGVTERRIQSIEGPDVYSTVWIGIGNQKQSPIFRALYD